MRLRVLFTFLSFITSGLVFCQSSVIEQNMNLELIARLDSIHEDDQKYREEAERLEKIYSWESKEIQDIWKLINLYDSINLAKVETILSNHGWLGADVIGEKGNKTLFLVIQHADMQTQQKYFPVLKAAVEKGNAKPGYAALMEDRILINQGKKQIYGSQLYLNQATNLWELSPVIDPDNVDQRRAEVGLMPLGEYLKNFNLNWDVEEFKAKMKSM